MLRCWGLRLLVALVPALASAALLRAGEPAARPPEPRLAEIVRLLFDVDESVRKAAEDEELVFATLVAYDQQLEASLGREMNTLNKTLVKLRKMQASLGSELGASRVELLRLGEQAQGSEQTARHYEAGTSEASNKFDRLIGSVQMLIGLLQGAAITPDGALVTQGASGTNGRSSRMYSAIRPLLLANKALQGQFTDVFAAFVPVTLSLTQLSQGGPPREQPAPHVRMTLTLLGRTIAALKTIKTRLASKRSQALLQLGAWQQKLTAQATSARASAELHQGVEAQKEQKAEELSFGTTFTEAVWKIDQTFYNTMQGSMQAKAELVESIRSSRSRQLGILKDLIDLLPGRDSEEAPSGSFIQVTSNSHHHLPKVSNLQFEIETALRNHKDTHSILLRVRQMLDKAAPVDASSVQGVVVQMGTALRDLSNDQSKDGEARQRCKSQQFHGAEEVQGLNADLALMSAVRNNTGIAVLAARGNLKGIAAKTHALERLSSDFSRMVTQAMATLEGQSRDRGTIMTAVQKAGEMAVGEVAKPTVTKQLEQMLWQLEDQERQERAYRDEQSSFRSHFLAYVRDYLQLLRERRGHYESSLSALELYANEVANDVAVQQASLGASKELQKESADLCDSVLRFYEYHNQRHSELKKALQVVLPQLPDIVGIGLEGSSGSLAWDRQ